MTYNELCEAILTAQNEMLKCKIEANSVTLNGRKYGKLINNCPPNMKPTIFGMAVKTDYSIPDDYDFLVQYESPQPQTNADKIRNMTDDKLAEFLGKIVQSYTLPIAFIGNIMIDNWLDWLKQEAE